MDEKIKRQIEELVKSKPLEGEWCEKPLTSSEIEVIEERLGFTFPKEYREFLEVFGWLDPGWGEEIIGKALLDYDIEQSVVTRTLNLREKYSSFPKNCAAINFDGGEDWYCIICDGKDKGRVIFWESLTDPNQVYPNIPSPEWFKKYPDWVEDHITGEKEDFWTRGLDFWSWLMGEIEERRQEKEEILKKERTEREGAA